MMIMEEKSDDSEQLELCDFTMIWTDLELLYLFSSKMLSLLHVIDIFYEEFKKKKKLT